MMDISTAPEPLNKLVWRVSVRVPTSSSSVVLQDVDEDDNEVNVGQSSSSVPHPFITGENVNIVERYLLEVCDRNVGIVLLK